MAAPTPPSKRTVDLEHPWLGLQSFDASTRNYFFGRDAEIKEVLQRLELKPLLVLYGRSGLGKTSLVNAGIIPRLADAKHRPLVHRLTYDYQDLTPAGQVAAAFSADAAVLPDGVGPPPTDALSRLWLSLHRCGQPSKITHLFLDQFEEVFTVGVDHPGVEDEVRDVLNVLLQGAMPGPIRQWIEQDDAVLESFAPSVPPIRVVLSMRQDYVYALHRWRRSLPQINDNLFELFELRGPQALLSVYEPGRLRNGWRQDPGGPLVEAENDLPPIVTYPMAEDLVRYIAGETRAVDLEEITAVPPFLSLICHLLNERRLANLPADAPADHASLDRAALLEPPEKILGSFYENAFAGRPVGIRRAVEDELLSRSGFRIALDEDSLIKEFLPHCLNVAEARRHLDELVDQRLLSANNSGSVRRYELTHDLLTKLVNESKAKRAAETQARRARQGFVLLGVGTLVLLGALIAVYFAYERQKTLKANADVAQAKAVASASAAKLLNTQLEAARTELDNVKNSFGVAKNTADENVRSLGETNRDLEKKLRAVGEKGGNLPPSKPPDTDPLFEELRPVTFEHPADVNAAVFYANGTRLATACADGNVRFWNVEDPKAPPTIWTVAKGHGVTSVAVDEKSRYALAGSGLGTQFFDLGKLAPVPALVSTAGVTWTAFGAGTTAVSACSDNKALLWTAVDGTVAPTPLAHLGIVTFADFNPTGDRLTTSCDDGFMRVWSLPFSTKVQPLMHPTGAPVRRAVFSPDGTRVVAATGNKTVCWSPDPPTSYQTLDSDTVALQAVFSPDGGRVAIADAAGFITLWTPGADGPGVKLEKHHAGRVLRLAWDNNSYLAAGSEDGVVELWRPTHDAVPTFVCRFQAHNGPVWSLGFSPDGHHLVTTSAFSEENLPSAKGDARWTGSRLPDNKARIWKVPILVAQRPLPPNDAKAVVAALRGPEFSLTQPDGKGNAASASVPVRLLYGAGVDVTEVQSAALDLRRAGLRLQSIQALPTGERLLFLDTSLVASADGLLAEAQILAGPAAWEAARGDSGIKGVAIQIASESQRWLATNVQNRLQDKDAGDVSIEVVGGRSPNDSQVRYFSDPGDLPTALNLARLLSSCGVPDPQMNFVEPSDPATEQPRLFEIWLGTKVNVPAPRIYLVKQDGKLTGPERDVVSTLKEAGYEVVESVRSGTGPPGMCQVRYGHANPTDLAEAQRIANKLTGEISNLQDGPQAVMGKNITGSRAI